MTLSDSSNGTSDSSQPDLPVLILDENFPQPLVEGVLAVSAPALDLRPWDEVNPDLAGLDDEELIRQLADCGYGALVTCDWRMLESPDVLRAMKETAFTVVGCKDVGHDPIRATGLLLYNLQHIAEQYVPQRPQPWLLSGRQCSPVTFANHVEKVEKKLGVALTFD